MLFTEDTNSTFNKVIMGYQDSKSVHQSRYKCRGRVNINIKSNKFKPRDAQRNEQELNTWAHD